MKVKGIRQRKTRAATVAALVGVCGLALSGGVGPASASAVPSSAATSIVPPAGSATTPGYSAIIRHQTSATDDQGELVLVAPDGRHKVIGEVSDGAEVFDVSTNARTVITGFQNEDTGELRLTIWSTETNARKYLRVKGGKDAVLTYNGLVVSRGASPMQLFSRSGTLLRTFDGTSYGKVTASADGAVVLGSDYETRRVQMHDVETGKIRLTVPLPTPGHLGCEPGVAFTHDFYIDCTDDGFVNYAYRVENWADPTPVKIAVPAARIRPVSDADGGVGYVYDGDMIDEGAEIPVAPQVTWMQADGSKSAVKVNSAPNDRYDLVGAHEGSVYLAPQPRDLAYVPSALLVRKDLSTGEDTVLAGKGTPVGGIVTSAVTVDWS